MEPNKKKIQEPKKVIKEYKYTNNYYKTFLDYLNETQDIPKVFLGVKSIIH